MTPMSKKTQGNRRLTSSADRSTVSRMTDNENATPQLITEDDVLAWYDDKDGRGKRHRRISLGKNYGLKPEDVWALIEQQEGYCPICGKPLYLEAGAGVGIAIDHEGEREQGHVRGAVHFKCNLLLGLVEELHGDPDSDPTIDLPHGYLTKPPAKNIKVGDSNLYDETIEDRKDRGRQGRICQREGCAKKIPATADSRTKFCSPECRTAVHTASKTKKISERRRKARQGLKCLSCGKRFNGVRLNQKYCSLECQRDFHNASRRARWRASRRKKN